MKPLDQLNWEPHVLQDEFDCAKGVYLQTDGVIEGDIPYVTAKAGGNGLNRFIGNRVLFPGNHLTVEKVRLSTYYQPAPFYCSHDVSTLTNSSLNAENAQFLATMIMRNGAKYSYGRQAQLDVVKREKVFLPKTSNGDVDYDYMEQYSAQTRERLLERYQSVLHSRLSDLVHHDIPELSEKDWAEFPLNEIFTVKSGVRLTTADKIPGQRPFIGATDNTNGVTGFVSNENASLDSNVLGVNYNGAPCIAFYHPYEAIFTDDVKRLELLHHENNPLILLFCKVIVMQQRVKYSYGYKFNAQRMSRQLLMLPVTDTGEIDYEYMEKYTENMLLRKYRQYSDYLASFLETDAEKD